MTVPTCAVFEGVCALPATALVQAIVDKMKTMSAELDIGVTAAGDLHLQVASGGLRLATELRGLQADPEGHADPLMCALVLSPTNQIHPGLGR